MSLDTTPEDVTDKWSREASKLGKWSIEAVHRQSVVDYTATLVTRYQTFSCFLP